MSKQTAVEWVVDKLSLLNLDIHLHPEKYNVDEAIREKNKILQQAKAMESKQLFLASNTSAKDAYKAGQETMSCGCYQIPDATTYEEWLYEQFKNKEGDK